MELKFKKGDRAICICRLKRRNKNAGSKWEYLTKANVRITSILHDGVMTQELFKSYATFFGPNHQIILSPIYRVYNIDFDRYETIEESYLKTDVEYNRDLKLKEIFNA